MNNKKESCSKLTESACKKKKCEKELITVNECFVNNKKVNCPN